MKPCPSDLLITEELYPDERQRLAQLRDLRASETCSKMLQNNVLNSSEYTPKGTRLGWTGKYDIQIIYTYVVRYPDNIYLCGKISRLYILMW